MTPELRETSQMFEKRSVAIEEDQQAELNLSNIIFFRLFQLSNAVARQSVNLLGISGVQWAVLGALSREGNEAGLLFGDLAAYLLVSRQNLDGVVKRLELLGLVERKVGPSDGRSRLVVLTDRGRAHWLALQPGIGEFYRESTQGLNLDEKISLAHWLAKLRKDLLAIEAREPADSMVD